MGLCVAFIALVRLPSLKVSTLLLVGLLIYDVFWVRINPSLVSYLCQSVLSSYTKVYVSTNPNYPWHNPSEISS